MPHGYEHSKARSLLGPGQRRAVGDNGNKLIRVIAKRARLGGSEALRQSFGPMVCPRGDVGGGIYSPRGVPHSAGLPRNDKPGGASAFAGCSGLVDLHDPAFDRFDQGLGAVGYVQFGKDVRDMNLHRSFGHPEADADFLVAQPATQKLKHLEFAR